LFYASATILYIIEGSLNWVQKNASRLSCKYNIKYMNWLCQQKNLFYREKEHWAIFIHAHFMWGFTCLWLVSGIN